MLSIAGGWLGKTAFGRSVESAVLDDASCPACAPPHAAAIKTISSNKRSRFRMATRETSLCMRSPAFQGFGRLACRLYEEGPQKFPFFADADGAVEDYCWRAKELALSRRVRSAATPLANNFTDSSEGSRSTS